ncbi:MAG TPA: ABC transporter ATP-binding protein [Spirochaetia bacterium]|nr:ABC transporter ATP-binding protein [Spirochaetia bacterium]
MGTDGQLLLDVVDLSKRFTLGGGFSRVKLTAVNKASFQMGAGGPEIFTLAGESGSGKTTIARMILGFIEPSSGSIRVNGRDVTKLKGRSERLSFMKEVQGVFQDPFDTFNPLKRIDSYLYETAMNFGIARDHCEAEQRAAEALSAVGLTLGEISRRYPHELSGGQAQRTSVARALMTHPSLVVADEPVSMVDASLRMSIVNLLKEFKEKLGISVLYITHDLATAYYVSDRIAIVLRGSIIEMGSVDRVLGNPLHPYTVVLRESVPEPDPARRWRADIELGALEVTEYARRGCKFAGRCPHEMAICSTTEPPNVESEGRLVRCHLYS